MQAAQGAGIQSAKIVCDSGCKAVVTGHCGPKAFATLQAAGVAVHTGAQGTVEQAIGELKEGKLTVSKGADVDGHW